MACRVFIENGVVVLPEKKEKIVFTDRNKKRLRMMISGGPDAVKM
jgi:hypothetical protein